MNLIDWIIVGILGLSVLVVAFGVKGGIERVSKFCLPVLFLLIVMISIYSLSLPLGATMNMDGSCITLMITALYFARIFNVPVSGSVLTSLFITIMVLSVGSPGVPGGNLVCIALLIPQIGIPAEAVSLVMGLYPIVSMMQTCTNVTGDAVVTTVVAKLEDES